MTSDSEKNSTTLQTGVEAKILWMKRINQLYPLKICFMINSYTIQKLFFFNFIKEIFLERGD